MIILNCHTGRMSNHKIMQAHVMAEALAHGERWYVAPDNWFWNFEAATLGRVWNKFVRMLPEAKGSRNRCFRLPWLTIVHGWTELRNFEAMKKYGDEIRKMFAPAEYECLAAKNAKNTKLVGVHVRRTDYREWQGGKFYFENEVYERVIDEIGAAIGGNVRFLVFTDEPKTLSPRLAQYNVWPTTPVRDQLLMSQCDYLVGPLSTFTAWASFMGKVPLLHIMDKDQKVQLCDFKMEW